MGALFLGLVFLVAGAFARYWVGKREFNRRNIAGIEEFQSYGGALATKSFEKLARIFSVVGIVAGLALIAVFFFMPK